MKEPCARLVSRSNRAVSFLTSKLKRLLRRSFRHLRVNSNGQAVAVDRPESMAVEFRIQDSYSLLIVANRHITTSTT